MKRGCGIYMHVTCAQHVCLIRCMPLIYAVCAWNVYMARMCYTYVTHGYMKFMYVTYAWNVCNLCMTCVKRICGLCETYIWHVCMLHTFDIYSYVCFV